MRSAQCGRRRSAAPAIARERSAEQTSTLPPRRRRSPRPQWASRSGFGTVFRIFWTGRCGIRAAVSRQRDLSTLHLGPVSPPSPNASLSPSPQTKRRLSPLAGWRSSSLRKGYVSSSARSARLRRCGGRGERGEEGGCVSSASGGGCVAARSRSLSPISLTFAPASRKSWILYNLVSPSRPTVWPLMAPLLSSTTTKKRGGRDRSTQIARGDKNRGERSLFYF